MTEISHLIASLKHNTFYSTAVGSSGEVDFADD